MVFIPVVMMFAFLLSTTIVQPSESNHDFLDKHSMNQENLKVSDTSDIVADFEVSEDCRKYFKNIRPTVQKSVKDRAVLWQEIIHDELQKRQNAQDQICLEAKNNAESTAQIHEIISPTKPAIAKKSPAKPKLTRAQKAKNDAENKFLDEQIQLQQEAAAEVSMNKIEQEELTQGQKTFKEIQKIALKTKIKSLRNKSDYDQDINQVLNQFIGSTTCSCCQKTMQGNDSDNDSSEIVVQECQSGYKQSVQKVMNNVYAISTTIQEDSFMKFYTLHPELIALVDTYKNKDSALLLHNSDFIYFVNKFLIFMNIPAKQRISMQADIKPTAALLWKKASKNAVVI